MSTTLPSTTDATFAADVLASDLPVLVDFTASWCGPCRMVTPVLEQLAAAERDRLRVVQLDVDANPEVTRVDALAAQAGLSVRRLQRLFGDYVGVPPKWVIRRYRLHEITERLRNGKAVEWAGLAADLGYADQAHLTRDFTKLVGEPPTMYAERY